MRRLILHHGKRHPREMGMEPEIIAAVWIDGVWRARL